MKITMDDIPYSLHMLVQIVGIENFIKICKCYGGGSLYIPMHKTLMSYDRNRKILEEFNGVNGEYLRKKHDISYTQLRKVLKKNKI